MEIDMSLLNKRPPARSMPRGKKKALPPPPPPDARRVNARGAASRAGREAYRHTGNRAQRGCLPGGTPRLVYEIVWKGRA